MILLVLELYIFGAVTTVFIGKDKGYKEQIEEHDMMFGKITRSMYTLWAMMMDGGDLMTVRPYVFERPAFLVVIVIFVGVTVLGMLNMFTAVIVESALHMAKSDEEAELLRLEAERVKEFEDLQRIFEQIDTDGSGRITKAEFDQAVQENQ